MKIKSSGNSAFKEKNFPKSIDKYKKAYRSGKNFWEYDISPYASLPYAD